MEETDKQKKIVMVTVVLLCIIFLIGVFSYMLLKNAQLSTQSQIQKTEQIAGQQLKTKSGFRLKVLNNRPTIGNEVQVAVYANSGKQDVVGFDLAISYPKILVYVGTSNNLEEFDIIETIEDDTELTEKSSKMIITGAKKIGNKKISVWNDNEIIQLKFKPVKPGIANLTFEMSPGSITDTNMFDNYNKDLVTIAVGSTLQIQ